VRSALEALDVLHYIYFPGLFHLAAPVVKHDAVFTKQYHCVGEQNPAFGLPLEECLLRFGELQRGEGWFENGNLILVDDEQLPALCAEVGMRDADVEFLYGEEVWK